MSRTSKNTSRYKGIPKQFHWYADEKEKFTSLVETYDPHLAVNAAILKLIQWAIQEHWLPGYIRLARDPKTASDGDGSTGSDKMDKLRPDKTMYKT